MVESHLLDFDQDLYDTEIRVAFIQRLREERTFSSVQALQEQIQLDAEQARELFKQISL